MVEPQDRRWEVVQGEVDPTTLLDRKGPWGLLWGPFNIPDKRYLYRVGLVRDVLQTRLPEMIATMLITEAVALQHSAAILKSAVRLC